MRIKWRGNFSRRKIILFGSFAWGTPTEDSDVDLFIVKEGEGKKWEKEKAVYKFLAGAKVPIDVLVYTKEEANQSRKKGIFYRRCFYQGAHFVLGNIIQHG